MLVVVPSGDDTGTAIGAEATPINYTFTDKEHIFPCHKKNLNTLERRRLDDCFTEDCRVSQWNMFPWKCIKHVFFLLTISFTI